MYKTNKPQNHTYNMWQKIEIQQQTTSQLPKYETKKKSKKSIKRLQNMQYKKKRHDLNIIKIPQNA